MHAVFIPYGKKEWVDIFLRDIAAQKLPMKMYKEGEKDTQQYIECQLRVLPFGFYEFVFPKEHGDAVLNTLRFDKPIPYGADKEFKIMGMKVKPLKYIRKFLNIIEAPEFKTDKKLLWTDMFVSIIPIGIRYDKEIEEPNGWKHEAI